MLTSSLTGHVVRAGPNYLFVSDLDLIKKTNAIRSSHTRGQFYDAIRLRPTEDNNISVRSETAHARLRTQLAPGVSTARM